MFSAAQRVVDFVETSVGKADGFMEQDLHLTRPVYGELARLKFLGEVVEDLQESGAEVLEDADQQILASLSETVAASEAMADLALGSLLSDSSEFSQRDLGQSVFGKLEELADPVMNAAVHMSEADVISGIEDRIGEAKKLYRQISPHAVKTTVREAIDGVFVEARVLKGALNSLTAGAQDSARALEQQAREIDWRDIGPLDRAAKIITQKYDRIGRTMESAMSVADRMTDAAETLLGLTANARFGRREWSGVAGLLGIEQRGPRDDVITSIGRGDVREAASAVGLWPGEVEDWIEDSMAALGSKVHNPVLTPGQKAVMANLATDFPRDPSHYANQPEPELFENGE